MNKTSDVLSEQCKTVLENKYCVYTLLSLKDSRLSEHFYGLVTSTKLRRPFKLIHFEFFINKDDAKAREIFLKSGFGRKQLKESLKRTLKSH